MANKFDIKERHDIAWCPGCGNYAILQSVKTALAELSIAREKLVFVSGIGQAAKLPQYVNAGFFNGLHGRSLPAATAIKASNPGLTVIAVSGDGCTYGEGGNHFIHCIRRNPDITNIVHNNMVYGLTKGQASPTSRKGFKTPVQINGVFLEPFNPLAVAVSLNASFVARVFSGHKEKTVEILKQAITHKGYALVDIFQPCVSFNKVNTYEWYNKNTYYVDGSYDAGDKKQAILKAMETDKFPLGIIYINRENLSFEENINAYKTDKRPLYMRNVKKERLLKLLEEKRIF